MNWGEPFQTAWRSASAVSQTAARRAVLGPEQAAQSLSESIVHTLQLLDYAAQDLQRQTMAKKVLTDGPGTSRSMLQQAMDDLRKGRVAPERAEKYLLQAVKEAGQLTPSAPSPDSLTASPQRPAAAHRCHTLVQRLAAQLAMVHAPSDNPGGQGTARNLQDDTAAVQASLRLEADLNRAIAAIDALFLENKAAGDPVAPLPPPPSPPEKEAEILCLTPRA